MTGSGTVDIAESDDWGRAQEEDVVQDGLKTLLLPVGPDDEGRIGSLAATASEAAGLLQTSVLVLHVFTEARFEATVERLGYDSESPPAPDTIAREVGVVRELTEALRTPLREWGVTMAVDGRVSDAIAPTIVGVADDVDAKRVVVSGRRRTPTGKAVFGSTAQRVLLDAPCPVTFVRDV